MIKRYLLNFFYKCIQQFRSKLASYLITLWCVRVVHITVEKRLQISQKKRWNCIFLLKMHINLFTCACHSIFFLCANKRLIRWMNGVIWHSMKWHRLHQWTSFNVVSIVVCLFFIAKLKQHRQKKVRFVRISASKIEWRFNFKKFTLLMQQTDWYKSLIRC